METNNDDRLATVRSYLTSAEVLYTTYCNKINDDNVASYKAGLRYLYENKLGAFNYAIALLDTNASSLRNANVSTFGNTLIQYILTASKAYDDVMFICNPNLPTITDFKNITSIVPLVDENN
jgi:hypothetical protein